MKIGNGDMTTRPTALFAWPCLPIVAALLLAAGPTLAAMQRVVYVSADGVDTNPGTAKQPLASLQGARDKVRAILAGGKMTGDIEVRFAAGDYTVDETVEFGAEDSGRDGHRIIYRNADGLGSARFVGGRRVVNWTRHNDHVWKATVGTNWVFHTLYEDGVSAMKARFPNLAFDEQYPMRRGPYLTSRAGTKDGIIAFSGEDLQVEGWDARYAEVVYWPGGKRNWTRDTVPVRSIDVKSGLITLTHQGKSYDKLHGGDRYFVQGILQELDQAGEFFLDEAAGVLYYWPRNGNPNEREILAPKVKRVVALQGEDASARIRDVTFEGLTFCVSDWTNHCQRWGEVSHLGASVWLNGMFYMQNTARIMVRNCHFKNAGYDAIFMNGSNSDNRIEGCWIEQTGGCGIMGYGDHGEGTPPPIQNNVIDNCLIHNVMELKGYGGAVFVRFGALKNTVSHCEIYNSTEYGLAWYGDCRSKAADKASGNRAEYLRIYKCQQDRGDCGAINAAHWGRPTPHVNDYRQIYISDTYSDRSNRDIAPNGIFMDNEGDFQSFTNVKSERSQGAPFRNNDCKGFEFNNVSWGRTFDDSKMEYATIGLKPDFPAVYGATNIWSRMSRPKKGESAGHGRLIDYSKHDPLQVLQILAASSREWVDVDNPPEGWLRREHIPELMKKLDSTQPCAGIHSNRDSRAPGIGGYGPEKKGKSTVGHEAALMIESFRHGFYPKTHAFSVDWPIDRDAIRAWWGESAAKDTASGQ